MRYFITLLLLVTLTVSCKEIEKKRITRLVNEWNGKLIYYPDSMCVTSYSVDTIITKCGREKFPYTILNYVDTVGCFSCKLQLPRWKEMIEEFDSIYPNKITCLMVFYSKNKKQLIRILKREGFNSFVYIDDADTLNQINKFIDEEGFHTFLLDKDNRIIAIGNPILNPNVKALYERIIENENPLKKGETKKTVVQLDNSSVNLGTFEWTQKINAEFTLNNEGRIPLVIDDITTSCGCTTVGYSKEPVQPGKSLNLKVKYQAEHPEHFNKTITVYCNAEGSPFHLEISGNAK